MLVNAELVRLGYAQVATYLPDVKYQDLFLQLQREAREAGRGSGSVSDRKEIDGAEGGENPYFTIYSQEIGGKITPAVAYRLTDIMEIYPIEVFEHAIREAPPTPWRLLCLFPPKNSHFCHLRNKMVYSFQILLSPLSSPTRTINVTVNDGEDI